VSLAVLDTNTSAPARTVRASRGELDPRPVPATWPATRASRADTLHRLGSAPFVVLNPKIQRQRFIGLELLFDWLANHPGRTWQERWLSVEADVGGLCWRKELTTWRAERGDSVGWHQDFLAVALRVAISADIVRPSFAWLLSGASGHGALVRVLAASRDTEGFARLREHCELDPEVSAVATTRTLYRSALVMAAKGGALSEITVGDVMELFDAEAAAHGTIGDGSTLFYRMLRQTGVFGDQAPTALRHLRTPGPSTPEQMIDCYRIACRPVRDLLVDYLKERQPALDHNSLRYLATRLGLLFWADIEAHNPGIDSLRLPPDVVDAWKLRLRTVTKKVRTESGEMTEVASPRLSYRECLTPVRALYLDLAHWAVEDPGRWAAWVAPCPVGEDETCQRKATRQRKSRMDARTRQLLPALPILVVALDRHRLEAATRLAAARRHQPGESFTVSGSSFVRRAWATGVIVEDPVTGKRRNLALEEERAFWAWAIVEVLRATGIRVEELLELSHHSLVQYRLPSTGDLVPLLQIVPSKTDAERLLVVSPELAEVLSTIIARIRGPLGTVPLVAGYDDYERVWLDPAPRLFQRRIDRENRAFAHSTLVQMLNRAVSQTGLVDPVEGRALHYTPHDFPQDVHHRCDVERPAAAHRPDHRRPPGHQGDAGLQGDLSRGGHPSSPRLPCPAAIAAPERGVPRPERRRVAGIPRALRAAKSVDRDLRPGVLDAVHS
jgi:hypothetical protein